MKFQEDNLVVAVHDSRIRREVLDELEKWWLKHHKCVGLDKDCRNCMDKINNKFKSMREKL